MSKIKKLTIILLLTIFLVLAGCGGDKGQKCKTSADCPSAPRCQKAYCSNGYCATQTETNCCGNNLCEEAAGESKCTCEKDCGKCSGSVTIEDLRGKKINAAYLKMLCDDNNECIASYEKSDQKSTEFFNEFRGTGFTFNIYAKYDLPFDKQSSKFNIELNLKDLDGAKIQPPITIKEIRLMEGSTIIGRRPTGLSFNKVGDRLTQPVQVSYILSQPEETKSLAVSIDYEYTPLRKVKDQYEPQPIERKTYKFSIKDKITLLDAALAE